MKQETAHKLQCFSESIVFNGLEKTQNESYSFKLQCRGKV